MATVAHSSGPWAYSKRDAFGYTPEHYVVMDADRNTVARVYLWASYASMIAAAPDLLAACKAAQRLISEALPKFDWGASALDANAIRLLNEAPLAVAAAIAKAEGR